MKHLNNLLNSEKFDIAVFAGGSLFMEYFAGIISCVVKKLNRSGIKVIFHSCGLSSLSTDAIKVLYDTFKLSNVISITLRDSYERFVELFPTITHVKETYDTALGCSTLYRRSEIISAEYGICLIGRYEYYEFQKELLLLLKNSNCSWKAFVSGNDKDYNVAIELLEDIGIPKIDQCEYLMRLPSTTEEFIGTVTSFKKVLSFRMHSLIVALSYNIPNAGFVYDDKVGMLYQRLGIENHGIEIQSSNADLDRINNIINSVIPMNAVEYAASHSIDCLIGAIDECINI